MAISSKYVSVLNHTTKQHDGEVLLGDKINELNPSYYILLAGKHTTAGGSATETKTLTGILSSDVAIVSLDTKGSTPRTIVTAAPTTNTLTIVFSGDPSTDHIVSYMILRAVT